MADGFEEIEAIAVIDILKRADVEVYSVSICDRYEVIGAHNIKIVCDRLFSEIDFSEFSMMVLIGGLKCVESLRECKGVLEMVKDFYKSDKYIAAICAAPTALGDAGILDGNKFTCYEGFEKFIQKGIYLKQSVVQDKNIITSNCAGSVFEFAFKLVSILMGEEKRMEVESRVIL